MNLHYYLANPVEILKVWHGGLASHGAAIGILLALWLFVRKEKKPYIWAIDRVVIVVALAGALIRLGNLMNSEIYGVETTLPWGFVFLRNGENAPKHPTQIYESLAYLANIRDSHEDLLEEHGETEAGTALRVVSDICVRLPVLRGVCQGGPGCLRGRDEAEYGSVLSIPFVIAGIVIAYLGISRKNPVAWYSKEEDEPRGLRPSC